MSAAARLIVVDGQPANRALEQAAVDLGLRLQHCRPSRTQLNDAVQAYRALFQPTQLDELSRLRAAAVGLMRRLAGFKPKAAGSLVDGMDVPFSALLFLQADAIETVIQTLYDQRVVWHPTDYALRQASGRRLTQPALAIETSELDATLVLLPANAAADPVCDPLDGKPMEMLAADVLETMTDATQAAQSFNR